MRCTDFSLERASLHFEFLLGPFRVNFKRPGSHQGLVVVETRGHSARGETVLRLLQKDGTSLHPVVCCQSF